MYRSAKAENCIVCWMSFDYWLNLFWNKFKIRLHEFKSPLPPHHGSNFKLWTKLAQLINAFFRSCQESPSAWPFPSSQMPSDGWAPRQAKWAGDSRPRAGLRRRHHDNRRTLPSPFAAPGSRSLAPAWSPPSSSSLPASGLTHRRFVGRPPSGAVSVKERSSSPVRRTPTFSTCSFPLTCCS